MVESEFTISASFRVIRNVLCVTLMVSQDVAVSLTNLYVILSLYFVLTVVRYDRSKLLLQGIFTQSSVSLAYQSV